VKEQQLQIMCVNWFRIQYPNLFIFAVPNGGSRHKLEAINLKREGATKGVADLVVLLPNGRCVFIEMKKPASKKMNPKTGNWNKVAGGKQTPEQKAFQETAESLGFDYSIIDNFESFQKKIQSVVDNYTTNGYI
jgi:hypothetical protein